MANKAETNETQDDENKSGSAPSTMKIILFAVVFSVLLSGTIVGAALYFMNGDDNGKQVAAAVDGVDADSDETEVEAVEPRFDPDDPPQYISMDPKFVVTFDSQKKARFMQFSLQVMTHDKEIIKLLKQHMPVVRSNLLMLVGSQEYENINTRDGKVHLLDEITADINQTLENVAGVTGVEAAYFDSFVIQ